MKWLIAFAFTQAFEVPIYLYAMRSQKLDAPLWERLLIAFGASALTHPIVWFLLPSTIPWLSFWGYVALAETFAVGAEAVILHQFAVKRPLLWAFAANATSAGLGLTSRWLFGVP